ncbi:hypothetical protein HBH64_213710 [Parastagonospora nodorum]|nr:hypothetical protein HBI02_213590 [Parastagonospora nodorum]KAH4288846.1 hypothetical protein HBI01_216360 [Parastagonospora nodorum]KAH4320757.1 hypothetical protein HBI00_223690 [Parastagonospora nodorum]KAH4360487.1 hypothetical protein HBH94_195410 [Parastagonospora nodorum]KAH4454678.1 hypothetical protein HBH90_168450 [Parastagonospora nodorum]
MSTSQGLSFALLASKATTPDRKPVDAAPKKVEQKAPKEPEKKTTAKETMNRQKTTLKNPKKVSDSAPEQGGLEAETGLAKPPKATPEEKQMLKELKERKALKGLLIGQDAKIRDREGNTVGELSSMYVTALFAGRGVDSKGNVSNQLGNFVASVTPVPGPALDALMTKKKRASSHGSSAVPVSKKAKRSESANMFADIEGDDRAEAIEIFGTGDFNTIHAKELEAEARVSSHKDELRVLNHDLNELELELKRRKASADAYKALIDYSQSELFRKDTDVIRTLGDLAKCVYNILSDAEESRRQVEEGEEAGGRGEEEEEAGGRGEEEELE